MGFDGDNIGMANALLNESFGASNTEAQQPNTQRNKYQSNAYLSPTSPLVPPESEEGEYTVNS